MQKAVNHLKMFSLVAVPITLLLSLKLNSINILICALLFIPEFITNIPKASKTENRLFFGLQAFVLCYLIGTLSDFHHGIYDLKKLERLLPFVVLPMIFAYGDIKNRLYDKKSPLKFFALIATGLGLLIALHFCFSHYKDYKDTSLLNKRWDVSGLIVKSDMEEIKGIKTFEVNFIDSISKRDLKYDKSISVQSDTTMTRSFFAKSTDEIWLLVRQYDGTNHKGAWFDIKNGNLGFVQSDIKADIIPIENGWFRIKVTNQLKKGSKRERLQITVVDGNKSYDDNEEKSSTFMIGGPQLEFGAKATAYSPLEHRKLLDEYNRDEAFSLFEGHPTYYSMFLVFSSLIYLFIFQWGWKIKLLAILVNLSIILLLGSKAAIISFVFLFIISHNYFKRNKKQTLFFYGGITAVFAVMLYIIPGIFNRFSQMFLILEGDSNGRHLSSGIRLELWERIIQLSQKNIFLGNGNLYSYNILSKTMDIDMNSHNQYFEALLCSGLLGLFFLLAYFFIPMLIHKEFLKRKLFTTFLLLVGFNLFFETMLNRQWGIVFVSYFMAYFCFVPSLKKDYE